MSVKGVQGSFRREIQHRTSGGIEHHRGVHDTLVARFEKLERIFPIDQVLTQTSFRAFFSVFSVFSDEATFIFVFNDFDALAIIDELEIPVQILAGILDFLVMIIEFGQGNVELLDVELGLELGGGCIGRLPHSLDSWAGPDALRIAIVAVWGGVIFFL